MRRDEIRRLNRSRRGRGCLHLRDDEDGGDAAPCIASLAILAWIFLGLNTARAATFQIADPAEFSKIIDTNAVLTTNATINTWLEGPVWVPSGGGYLVFCDQNNNRLKKLVPPATVTDFLLPPANTLFNGTMLDARERLIAAEAG